MSDRYCEICGSSIARYVCSNCGSQACEECFEHSSWRCKNCAPKAIPQLVHGPSLIMLFLGFVFIIAAFIILILAATGTGTGAFIVAVGPIPFFFSSDRTFLWLAVVALVAAFAFFLVPIVKALGRT